MLDSDNSVAFLKRQYTDSDSEKAAKSNLQNDWLFRFCSTFHLIERDGVRERESVPRAGLQHLSSDYILAHCLLKPLFNLII